MALSASPEKVQDSELLRAMVGNVAQWLMQLDVEGLVGTFLD